MARERVAFESLREVAPGRWEGQLPDGRFAVVKAEGGYVRIGIDAEAPMEALHMGGYDVKDDGSWPPTRRNIEAHLKAAILYFDERGETEHA